MATYRISTPQGDARITAPSGLSKKEVIELYNRAIEYDRDTERRESQKATSSYLDARQQAAERIALSRKPTIGDRLGEIPKGALAGAAGILETGLTGVATLLPEDAENVVRGGIQSSFKPVQDYLSPDINLQDSIPRKVSEAVGSFGGLLATSIVNPAAGLGLAVSAGVGEASERARAADATQSERNLAALYGIIPGAIDILPIRFLKLLGDTGVQSFTNKLQRIVAEGGVEAGQEAVSSVSQNLIERGYNPTRKVLEGTGEEAALGGTVGAIVQGTIELFTPRTRAVSTGRETDLDQGELFPDDDLGKAPVIPKPKPDQGELFPDDDLGKAPEKPDTRQKDLFATADAAFARRAKAAEREREQLLRRPISEFKEEGDPFFERTKRERDEALSGLAALQQRREQPVTTTRDMRDMVAELQDIEADERARVREGLRAAARGDETVFEQPDLFAQEIERDRRRLGPEELRRPDQFMDDLFFEEAEKIQDVSPAADGDLVDIIREKETEEAKEVAAERLRREAAEETAQGKIDTDRAAQTKAVRTRILQNTVANAGEIRKPKALQNLFERALAKEGLANTKATPAEVESIRRASSAIRAKDPVAEAAAKQEAIKDPRQRELEGFVAPRKLRRSDAIKSEFDGTKSSDRVSDAETTSSGVGGQGVGDTPESVTPDDRTVGQDLPPVGETFDRTTKQSSALDRPAGQVIPGTRYGTDPKTLKRTGKITFVDDSLLAPKTTVQLKDTETNFATAIKDRWNKLNQIVGGTAAAARRRAEAIGGIDPNENRFSNKLNKAIFNRLDKPNTKEVVENNNRYLNLYPNPEAAVANAYVDAGLKKKKEQGAAPAEARKLITFIEGSIDKNSNDKDILDQIKAEAVKTNESIDAVRGIADIFSDRNANTYASGLQDANTAISKAINTGDLDTALTAVRETRISGSKDDFVINMAEKFKTLLRGHGVKLKVVDGLEHKGESVQGLYKANEKTIFIDSVAGMDAHTLLHETAHAVTAKVLTNPTKTQKPARDAIVKLFEETKSRLQSDGDTFPSVNGLANEIEFVAELLSNKEFRGLVLSKPSPDAKKNILQRFRDVIRSLIGKPATVTEDKLNGLIEAVMRPDPDDSGEGTFALGTRDNVKEALKKVRTVQRDLNKNLPDKRRMLDRTLDFLKGYPTAPNRLLLGLTGLQSLADVAKSYGFKQLGFDLDRAISNQRGDINKATEIVKNLVQDVQSIFDNVKNGDEVLEKLNELIYNEDFGSTIYDVDPFAPASTYKNKDGTPKLDPDGNSLLDVWNAQRPFVKDIGPEGRIAYKKMKEHYKDSFIRARKIVAGELDALAKEAVQEGDTEAAESLKKVRKDIYQKLFEMTTIGEYFPLVREGNFTLVYYAKDPKTPRDSYSLEMFSTREERERRFKEVQADPKFDPERTRMINGEPTVEDYQSAPPTAFVYEVVNALSKAKASPESIQEVMRLFVATLPETSFAKSLQKRKGISGFMKDSMYALRTKGYDIAVQAQKLKAASNIRAIEAEIQKAKPEDADKSILPTAVRDRIPDRTAETFEDIRTELRDRARFAREGARNKGLENVGRRLNQMAFVYTIGFNVSSALINTSQIPLFVLPYLGARYKGANTALLKASKLALNVKNSLRDFYDIDLDGNINLKSDPQMSQDLRDQLTAIMPLVKEAADRGQLVNQGYIAESMGLDESTRIRQDTGIGRVGDLISGISAYLFNHAEKFNRQTTMIASYNLHIDKITGGKGNPTPEQQQEAAIKAIRMAQEANGGAYLETGPRYAREGIGRVALMYKSYGLQMYYSMFKQARRMLDRSNLTPEERKEAFYTLVGLHGSALFFAGVQGIPLYGAFRLLMNAVFLDDEEPDADTMVRKNIGEFWYKGPLVAATGLDTATRTALTGLLIQDNKYNPNASVEENILFHLGGPALSTLKRFDLARRDFSEGNIERGFESVLPTAASNAYKSLARYTREGGVYTRRGDPVYDDMSTLEHAGILFGIQPAGLTKRRDVTSALKRIDIAVNKKRTKLNRKLYTTMRYGDIDGMLEAYRDINKFNARHPEAAILPDTIKKSIKRHMQTSAEMYNGTQLSGTYKDTLMEIGRALGE